MPPNRDMRSSEKVETILEETRSFTMGCDNIIPCGVTKRASISEANLKENIARDNITVLPYSGRSSVCEVNKYIGQVVYIVHRKTWWTIRYMR